VHFVLLLEMRENKKKDFRLILMKVDIFRMRDF